jgi:hypothetical protein
VLVIHCIKGWILVKTPEVSAVSQVRDPMLAIPSWIHWPDIWSRRIKGDPESPGQIVFPTSLPVQILKQKDNINE